MGRFIIVDDKHTDDGYRREEMHQRMGGYRMGGVGNYHGYPSMKDYDDGYRRGYTHGYKDHEEEMMSDDGMRRYSRYGR